MARLQDLFLVAAVVVASSSLPAATLTVDLSGGADYTDIQSAIDAAKDGDTVLVKPGEYVINEPIDFNRLHDSENPASPPVKNIVVKSEGGAEVTIIKMGETPTNPDRASVVIFGSGETSATVLEGISLMRGKGTKWGSDWWQDGGGGILCHNNSSPALTSCSILGNSATDGGGLYCVDHSSPTLDRCTISKNWALSSGSDGVKCYNYSSPIMSDCTISEQSGHGLGCLFSSPTITNCTISKNGIGIFCWNESTPTLTNCTIVENRGYGVQCASNASPGFLGCTITRNGNEDNCPIGEMCGTSGAVLCEGSPRFIDCTITDNLSVGGGGVVNSFGSPIFSNCTIVGNSSDLGCMNLRCGENSMPTLINCIVWDNSGRAIYQNGNSGPSISHSCVEGDLILPGEGNLNSDPLFVQPGRWDNNGTPDDPSDDKWIPGDYHLQSGSPAIDAGTLDDAPAIDIEGHGRPCGAGVDIGAYEFGDCAGPGCGDPNGDEDLDGVKNGTEDLNGDGVCASHDTDGDGIPNILDPDDDGDGVPTADELVYQDTDGDEIPNYLDDDDDGDGILSRLEDLNGNGDPSDDDPNSDGIPAYLDPNEKTPLVLFRRGDANDDSKTDISDAIATLGFLFLGNPNRLDCHKAADMDDSGVMDISDAVYPLSFQFLGGPAPEQPYPACGVDETEDLLTCESYIGCP